MRELLEFILALVGAVAFASLTVGGAILGGCVLTAGGCYLGWRRWKRRAKKALTTGQGDKEPDA